MNVPTPALPQAHERSERAELTSATLTRRIRWLLALMIGGLIISGVTAIPLPWEITVLHALVGLGALQGAHHVPAAPREAGGEYRGRGVADAEAGPAHLRVAKQLGTTILFVTHDLEEAVYLSDDIHVLSGRPSEIVLSIESKLVRPRDQLLTREHSDFLEYRHAIYARIRSEVTRARRAG